ncbi:phosphopantothenoylcysteine decarboxylase, partial [Martelella sp. AD-3]
KKRPGEAPPPLALAENPDILKTIGNHQRRPALVVGFAAETSDVAAYARDKLSRKGADLIVANDVSKEGVMGGARNEVTLVTKDGAETWPDLDKTEVAARLAAWIANRF